MTGLLRIRGPQMGAERSGLDTGAPARRLDAFTLRAVLTVPRVPWLVCVAALGDGGPEHAALNADRPRSNSSGAWKVATGTIRQQLGSGSR